MDQWFSFLISNLATSILVSLISPVSHLSRPPPFVWSLNSLGEVAQDHLFPHAFDNFLAANPHFVPNPPSRPFSSDLPFYGDSPLKVSFRRMYWGGEEVNLFEQMYPLFSTSSFSLYFPLSLLLICSNPDTSEEESDDDLVTATEGEGELGFGGGVEKDESNSPAASSYYLRASFRYAARPVPTATPSVHILFHFLVYSSL